MKILTIIRQLDGHSPIAHCTIEVPNNYMGSERRIWMEGEISHKKRVLIKDFPEFDNARWIGSITNLEQSN